MLLARKTKSQMNNVNPADIQITNISFLGINPNKWNKNVFVKPAKQVKNLLRTIEHLSTNQGNNKKLINNKLLELEVSYDTQEAIAKQESRNNTVALDDKNTKYFHVATLKRKKENHIECIHDKNDQTVSKRNEV